MKTQFYIAVLLVTMVSCSEKNEENTVDTTQYAEEVIERAKIDATQILGTDSGTMDRERMILEVHATAERLRQAGDSIAANLYVTTVRKIVEQK